MVYFPDVLLEKGYQHQSGESYFLVNERKKYALDLSTSSVKALLTRTVNVTVFVSGTFDYFKV